MSNVFEARDPNGVRIYCETQNWNQHILLGHPMMRDNIHAIVETVEKPDYIFESHDSSPPKDYRQVYVKESKSATYYSSSSGKPMLTKVVASVCGGSGETITTFPTLSSHGGTKGDPLYRGKNDD